MFASGSGVVVTLAVVVAAVVAVLASPAGRRATAAALGSVGRWPALIRAELRGNGPLTAEERRAETTPDIPVVVAADEPLPPTRGFPQVGHPRR